MVQNRGGSDSYKSPPPLNFFTQKEYIFLWFFSVNAILTVYILYINQNEMRKSKDFYEKMKVHDISQTIFLAFTFHIAQFHTDAPTVICALNIIEYLLLWP